jgi:hypothetical protein
MKDHLDCNRQKHNHQQREVSKKKKSKEAGAHRLVSANFSHHNECEHRNHHLKHKESQLAHR